MERLTQGASGTRPSQGMLNNPFRYLRRKWTMQSARMTNALYSAQPACECASASSFLPIGICKSKSHQRALVEAWFIGVNEKRVRHARKLSCLFKYTQVLCQFCKGHVHIY